MNLSGRFKRLKQTSTDSTQLTPSPSADHDYHSPVSSCNLTIQPGEIPTDNPPILRLPYELLSAIIDYLPKNQWPSLELVNRSFRDSVYLSWHSVKEFDVGKDVLTIRQELKGTEVSPYLASILAKLLLRSPMLSSIRPIGLPYSSTFTADETTTRIRSEILQTISRFTHLKRIDLGAFDLNSEELMELLTSSASHNLLKEFISSANLDYITPEGNWQTVFTSRLNLERHAPPLKLDKFSLKSESEYHDVLLDPRIIDLIDLSSLSDLVLIKIGAPSDYLLSLINNCRQLQRLQFSFIAACRCKEQPCDHLINSKKILETIPTMENLRSLNIGIVKNDIGWHHGHAEGTVDRYYLHINDDLPILFERLGQRGRLVDFGLLDEYYCTDQVIAGIADHLTSLKSLELFTQECQPAVLVNMIKKLVNLEKLTFNCDNEGIESEDEEMICWNCGITSEVFDAVAMYLQNLKSLHLYYPYYDVADCLHVLTRLEHLEELYIFSAYFSEVDWEDSFYRLRSLKMWECHEELVASILNQAPELRRLHLGGSLRLPNNVLHFIPKACPHLRELNVAGSWGNTMEGVLLPGLCHYKSFPVPTPYSKHLHISNKQNDHHASIAPPFTPYLYEFCHFHSTCTKKCVPGKPSRQKQFTSLFVQCN